MPNSLTTEELWNKLTSLDPKRFEKMRPDLDMLREAYRRNQQRDEGQIARNSFENALANWTDVQMKEFLLKWLYEPGQLVGIATASPSQLNHLLQQTYKYIFE